jgi:DamX protein
MSMGAAKFPPRIGDLERAHGTQPLPLISAARMQKFDLLLHLALNLAQPIVVCGPKGIGKTTFLRLLETRLAPLATVCYLASMPGMSYERILDELSLSSNQDRRMPVSQGSVLADLLANYGKEHRPFVLLLDDAGALVPGLLNALWQFASAHPALRVILAMRPDEALQKSDTDRAVLGDAFILDVPALSQDECRFYAHQLAATVPGLKPEGMTESFIRQLYSRSRGVPGVVVEMLKSPLGSRHTAALAKAGWIAGAGLFAGAAAYAVFLVSSEQTPVPDRPLPGPDRVVSSPVPERDWAVETSRSPEIQASPMLTAAVNGASSYPPSGPATLAASERAEISPVPAPAAAPIPVQPPTAEVPAVETEAKTTVEDPRQAEPAGRGESSSTVERPEEPKKNTSESVGQGSSSPAEPTGSLNEPAAPMLVPDTSNAQGEKDQRSKSAEITVDGLKSVEWLMSQSPEAYTLQIVAVSRLSSVLKLAKQFPPGSQLASFRSRKGRNDLYPLFFGIYPTSEVAKEAAASLPVSLGQPLLRQMKSIHQEIRRMMLRHADLGASADPAAH